MAKRFKKKRQQCRFCRATGVIAVFEEPTRRTAGQFYYQLHDRPEGGKCDRSDKPVGIVGWPDWAMEKNEEAIAKLNKRR